MPRRLVTGAGAAGTLGGMSNPVRKYDFTVNGSVVVDDATVKSAVLGQVGDEIPELAGGRLQDLAFEAHSRVLGVINGSELSDLMVVFLQTAISRGLFDGLSGATVIVGPVHVTARSKPERTDEGG